MPGESMHVILSPDHLSAVYDPIKHQLTLCAQGNYVVPLINPKFVQRTIFGGLLFEVSAWTNLTGPGPAGHKWDVPYEFCMTFPINLFPYNEKVIIITGNHPHGIPIPIDYLGWGKSTPGETSEETTKFLQKTVQNETIHTLESRPFSISAPASHSGDDYTVNVDFNCNILTLKNAEIKGGEIVWSFMITPHVPYAATQVVVTQFGVYDQSRPSAWLVKTVYDIVYLPGPGKE